MSSLIRFWRVALPLGLLLATAVVVPLKLFDHRGLARVRGLKSELERVLEENEQIRAENNELRRQIQAFHTDPAHVERVARDELGMIGPGEVIYQFPNK